MWSLTASISLLGIVIGLVHPQVTRASTVLFTRKFLASTVLFIRKLLASTVLFSLVPRPTSQLRMDYITATRIVGLVSSCTNFCPVAPECWSDQSDLRYAYSSYQSKLSDISYGGKARDG